LIQDECASCRIDVNINPAVNGGGGKSECLLKIFLFEIGIILKQLQPVCVGCQNVEHSSDRDAHASDALLSPHFSRLKGDSVERRVQMHMH
jgi:hypothetical protein